MFSVDIGFWHYWKNEWNFTYYIWRQQISSEYTAMELQEWKEAIK